MTGIEQRVVLNFFICGHTKKVCDGSFGHVKRLLHRSDVKTRADMMGVIENSSTSTRCIPSADVQWTNWKDMFKDYFTIPVGFGISKYHEFSFDAEKKGFVMARLLSTSEEVRSFSFLKRTKDEEALNKKLDHRTQ